MDGTFADSNANGELDICEAAPIPAVSEWGLIVLAMVMLAAGTICLRRMALAAGKAIVDDTRYHRRDGAVQALEKQLG